MVVGIIPWLPWNPPVSCAAACCAHHVQIRLQHVSMMLVPLVEPLLAKTAFEDHGGLAGRPTLPCPSSQRCRIPQHPNLPMPATFHPAHPPTVTPLLPQLCSTDCSLNAELCRPLTAFQLRLADNVLDGGVGQELQPEASRGLLVQGCDPRGPGMLWDGSRLEVLGTNEPAEVGSLLASSVSMGCVCGS